MSSTQAPRCTARIYVKDGAYRYRVNVEQCKNRTSNASGRCHLHDGRITSAERNAR